MGLEVIFLGPPGAGKGVHSSKLSQDFRIPHISTGDMLREFIKSGSGLGLEARGYMDRGELVPDTVVIRMVLERVGRPDAKDGFLMDGFPRTPEQARGFSEAMALQGRAIRMVLYLRTSNEMAIKRIQGRRVCTKCGRIFHIASFPPKPGNVCDLCDGPVTQRQDDLPETVKHRLEVYEAQTAPLVEYYRSQGLMREVNCDRPFGEAHKELEEIFRTIFPVSR